MSKTPQFDEIERIPPTSYEEGAPLSVYRAIALRNNIQFYVDQIPQVRSCWATQVPVDGIYDTWGVDTVGGDARVELYQEEFEHTWIREDWPTALDIKVTGRIASGGGDDLTMYVRVVPASAPLNDPQAPALFTGSGVTTGINTDVVVEGFFVPNYLGVSPSKPNTFEQITYDENGVASAVQVAMLRLEVIFYAPADDRTWLTGVYVREWAWHHEAA